MPALLTRMSIPPSSATARSTAPTTALASALSARSADAFTPKALRRLHGFVRLFGFADISQCDMSALAGETFDDGSADASAAAGDQGTLVLKGEAHQILLCSIICGRALCAPLWIR